MSIAYFAKKTGNRYEVRVVNGYSINIKEGDMIFHMSTSDVEGDLFHEILTQKVMKWFKLPYAAIILWMCDSSEMQDF